MNSEPAKITRLRDQGLRITWGDRHESLYPWPFLRQACPCAACTHREAGPDVPLAQRPIPGAGIHPRSIESVGRYALHITWSDGHTTGIYAFDELRRRCPCAACRVTEADPAAGQWE